MLQWEHSPTLLTFIKLPFVIKTFVLSIFEWSLKTGFTILYGDLVYRFKIIVGKPNLSDLFKKIIKRYIKV